MTQNANLLDWNLYKKLTSEELKNNPVKWIEAGITPPSTEPIILPKYYRVDKITPDSPEIDISKLSIQFR